MSLLHSDSLRRLSEMTKNVKQTSLIPKMSDLEGTDILAQSPDGKVIIRKEINGNEIQSLPSGIYGWADIDGIKLPYLLRGIESFVSVKLVERLFLSKYPNQYPDEIKRVGPLVSHYASTQQASLMNEIDQKYRGIFLKGEKFTTDELLVQLDQFSKFYNIVKSHFTKPDVAKLSKSSKMPLQTPIGLPQSSTQSPFSSSTQCEVGWVQLNNTVVPFVKRSDVQYLPISVVRNAAKLLYGIKLRGVRVTKQELESLNNSCRDAGLVFSFTMKCKLLQLKRIQDVEGLKLYCVKVLQQGNPFNTASFIPQLDATPSFDVPFTHSASSHNSPRSTTPMDTSPSIDSVNKEDTMAFVNAAVKAAKQRQVVSR